MTFLFRPLWLLGHVAVAVVVVVMINLGLWQLRRLEERRADNERVIAALGAPPVTIDAIAGRPLEEIDFRPVRVTGEYDTADEFLVRYRSLNGLSGHYVVTPLVLDNDSGVVLVNRGWVPAEYAADWPVDDAAPPAGTVELLGHVRRPEQGSAPFWLQLASPAERDGIPATVPLPETDEGPHLSYAIQWFIFSLIVGGGWLILIRISALSHAAKAPDVTH